MPTITPGTPLHSFADAFRKATKDVFSQALGASWEVEIDTADIAPSPQTSVLCFQLSASGALQGEPAWGGDGARRGEGFPEEGEPEGEGGGG